MPQLTAYLTFDGTCREAMKFYEGALNGKIERMMTNGESPMANMMPPGNENRIMHSRLDLPDETALMAGDSMIDSGFQGMKGFNVVLNYDTRAEGEKVFKALSAGAQNVIMDYTESFWAEGFGMLIDKFGTPWIVNGGMKPF